MATKQIEHVKMADGFEATIYNIETECHDRFHILPRNARFFVTVEDGATKRIATAVFTPRDLIALQEALQMAAAQMYDDIFGDG